MKLIYIIVLCTLSFDAFAGKVPAINIGKNDGPNNTSICFYKTNDNYRFLTIFTHPCPLLVNYDADNKIISKVDD